jgi:soluble lytic murein transglycosylase-like protein
MTNTTNTTRRPLLRRGLRGQLAQGALALSALLGAVAVTDVTGAKAGDALAPKPAAAVATRQPTAALPTAKFVAEVVAPAKAEPAPTVDSATVLAAHFEKKGYPVTETLAETIAKAAEKHGIDLKVAFGLVRAESGFSSKATSHVGAIGLTQLMPRTAAWLKKGTTVRDLRDPATNADIGFGYLKDLIEKYDGNLNYALLAYNRGPGTVDKILKRGGNPDNGYAKKVMSM